MQYLIHHILYINCLLIKNDQIPEIWWGDCQIQSKYLSYQWVANSWVQLIIATYRKLIVQIIWAVVHIELLKSILVAIMIHQFCHNSRLRKLIQLKNIMNVEIFYDTYELAKKFNRILSLNSTSKRKEICKFQKQKFPHLCFLRRKV